MIHITDNNFSSTTETSVTLGNFDGLHLGHQRLVEAVKSEAHDARSVVFSFWPHPAEFFKKEAIYQILTRDEKKRLLEQMNVDVFIEYPFTIEMSLTPPEIFVTDILHKQLKCKFLAVGEDYRFGRAQQGNVRLLEKLCSDLGIALNVVPHIMYGEEKISSSAVRRFIRNGEFDKAEQCLGRPYFISGTVAASEGNLFSIDVPDMKLLPGKGSIYGTRLLIHGRVYPARTRIATAPTRTAETIVSGLQCPVDGSWVDVLFDTLLN